MEVHQDQIKDVYIQEAKEVTKEALNMVAQDVVDVDAQGIVSLAAQDIVDWASYGITNMAVLGTTCMAVQGITDLVANNTTDFLYNWSSRIKSNLVLVLFSALFICTLAFCRESHSLPESLVVPIPFTTITLSILRTDLPEKGDNINRIVDQPQQLHFRISTYNIGTVG
jgi:hypothetical protein